MTDGVKEAFKREKTSLQYIPGGMTPILQPIDTHVNKSLKASMRRKWEDWLLEGEQVLTFFFIFIFQELFQCVFLFYFSEFFQIIFLLFLYFSFFKIQEFTKSGKRKRASYALVCEWVSASMKEITRESFSSAMSENGLAMGDCVYHSRLQKVLAGEILSDDAIVDSQDSQDSQEECMGLGYLDSDQSDDSDEEFLGF